MKLRNKLSFTFAFVVLLTVILLGLLSHIFINNEFEKYRTKQQKRKTQEIVSSIQEQYQGDETGWDLDAVHTIGMSVLYNGYIVRVLDPDNQILWDAEECDKNGCMNVMNEIALRMKRNYPGLDGKFTSSEFPLLENGASIGTVKVSYYGPYFLNDDDFDFLNAINIVFLVVGIFCLVLSVVVGLYMSKRISDPVSKAAKAARQMSNGDYITQIEEKSNTIELNELVDSVNNLSKSLSYQESLRKQLTADVSHELRTPLTSILAHLEAMIEGIWEPTAERLSSCYEEVSRIGILVKDLESLARIDNGNVKLNITAVSLRSLWIKVINSFERDIQNKELAVILDGDVPDFPADEDRLRQVLINLLSNAIKYTPSGGHISIAILQTKEHIVFTVTDDGIGIPEHELPFIFERFYRADKSRNHKTGGAGIGLAVVKSIIKAHVGKIEVESREEYGSRFIIKLPIN